MSAFFLMGDQLRAQYGVSWLSVVGTGAGHYGD
jgi:hypothetical protein